MKASVVWQNQDFSLGWQEFVSCSEGLHESIVKGHHIKVMPFLLKRFFWDLRRLHTLLILACYISCRRRYLYQEANDSYSLTSS